MADHQITHNKTIADIVNLKGIIEEVLRDYDVDEKKRLEIAQRINERYSNLVKQIATKFLEEEAKKRSTIATFKGLGEGGDIPPHIRQKLEGG